MWTMWTMWTNHVNHVYVNSKLKWKPKVLAVELNQEQAKVKQTKKNKTILQYQYPNSIYRLQYYQICTRMWSLTYSSLIPHSGQKSFKKSHFYTWIIKIKSEGSNWELLPLLFKIRGTGNNFFVNPRGKWWITLFPAVKMRRKIMLLLHGWKK